MENNEEVKIPVEETENKEKTAEKKKSGKKKEIKEEIPQDNGQLCL